MAGSSLGLDLGVLAAARCAGFELPPEPAFVAETAGFPVFGACGHLTMMRTDSTPIWSPDLSVLVASARQVSFSPEGTRAIFVPAPPDDDRVRRLDLTTLKRFDTPVANVAELDNGGLNYGLFVNPLGDVESWVCSDRHLRLFADRTAAQSPLLEATVPSCSPQVNDGTLVWSVGASVKTIDLRGARVFDQSLPPYDTSEGGVWPALDGYAGGRFTTDPFAHGPLYSLRDGSLLANTYEQVPYFGSSNNAANSLDPQLALLVDDGTRVISVSGVRGLYVFRDKRRAFAFQALDADRAALVYLDIVSGKTTPIAEYSSHVLDPSVFALPAFGVSPSERAAYFSLDPVVDPSDPSSQRAAVVRWIEGESHVLSDTVPAPATNPAVSDDGTAVFMGLSTSTRFRPGLDPLIFPGIVGLDLSEDGAVDLTSAPVQGQSESEVLVTNLENGGVRTLLSNLSTLTNARDLFHERYAILFGRGMNATLHELWAGRYPAPPVPSN
ncbi:MAG TPA: hypothetical protein VER96_02070 [Polyangiaceae bacterium]|nr:hypothetical protein [Polyangiaceae bacterium]